MTCDPLRHLVLSQTDLNHQALSLVSTLNTLKGISSSKQEMYII